MPNMYKTNEGSYYIQWKDASGKWRARSLGKDRTQARIKFKELRFKDIDATFSIHQDLNPTSFFSLSKKYLEYSRSNKKPRTTKDDEHAINLWMKIIGDINLDKIKVFHIDQFANHRLQMDKVNKTTLKINLSALRAIFNWARRMEITNNYPFKNFKMSGGERRLDYMSKDELKRLFKIAPEPLKTYFIILAITGWRPGEFYSLTWDNINKDKIILYGKTGKRVFPIIDKVGLKILPYELTSMINKCRKYAETEYLFEINGKHVGENWLQRSFRKYVISINNRYSLYTLRHTFATQLLLAGVNILAVSKLMGHSSVTTTQIYEHIAVGNIEMLL